MKHSTTTAGRAPAARRWRLPGFGYSLVVPTDERRGLALAWLALAVGALVASGLFALLLVAARTPGVKDVLPGVDFFHVALVVHVDLSVLVWFASMAGLLWSLSASPRWLSLGWAGWTLALLGALGMSASAFGGDGKAVMANYVPMLTSQGFQYSLLLFGAGLALATLRAMAVPSRVGTTLPGEGALRFGFNAAAVSMAVALAALVWSWLALRSGRAQGLDDRTYFELLFWGPGHVVQFTWTLLMLAAWLWLATLIGAPWPLSPRIVVLLFAVALASVFATPVIYLAWPVGSVEHSRLFTWLMRFGGGLAIVPMVLALAVALWSAAAAKPETRPLRAALVWSVLLFCVGGGIGFLIRGSDVRIPAHYHGSIVGITLALMGVAYALLPSLGLAAPRSRLAAWQPAIYGAGQLLHIVGLVWSGGYGVQRKVAGAEQVLRTPQEVAGMGLMGFGGLVAIVGGLLFIVVVWQAWRARPTRRAEGAT